MIKNQLLVFAIFTVTAQLTWANAIPKALTIIENNGRQIHLKVGQLIEDKSEYYYRVKNDNEIILDSEVPVHINESINFKTPKTGKYTIEFFYHKPGQLPPWRMISKGFQWIFNNPIWVQDFFVITEIDRILSEHKKQELAKKYAPILLFDQDENYLPASIEYLTNKEENDKELSKLELSVNFNLYDQDQFVEVADKSRKRLVERKNIKFKFDDLAEVLAHNGDNIAVLDTKELAGEDSLIAERYGNPDNITVYYSIIPNLKQNVFYLNYHFLYSFDPKLGDADDQETGSHVFDRESMTIILNAKTLNPETVIYNGHLANQKLGYLDESGNALQTWKGGKVKLKWEDTLKKDTHPLAAIALGSHALYPVPGTYTVYLKEYKKVLVEPARGDEIYDPSQYKLKDLEIENINSSSWNNFLAFSGYTVDVFGPVNAKMPPFTEREISADKWNKELMIYPWNMKKLSNETKRKTKGLLQ